MKSHHETHRVGRVGWLRAAVLGANDGLISTSSLVVGVSAANFADSTILMTGLAGLVGGALSMAAGEYVSVSSQADSEAADLARESRELAEEPEAERRELAGIYIRRGLSRELAERVAAEMTRHDALAAHARDELGITDGSRARPVTAAGASAAAFSVGALPPLLLALLLPASQRIFAIFAISLVLLMMLGSLGARLGGAPQMRAALRVGFWGIVAMGVTSLVGRLFGVEVP
ncbi:MAG TPA: VIT family protein [Steroidobacteraceae bacterium]|nr:VIT family protein [Steroidobacteraceae bacterium]